ncbi:WD40 repeat-like protein [Gonapodya prolifera JEL478]|uniref:WD40 repeat-like protein n=1 Tax=Gonapodya prolifera (strain JEL478) TaxID=1344416 RepID=A0A139AY42_GONPJ|nr:WD40 repeat-like protein [Gonapodya prolifera JEL478]|eukprot:KXS21639.1 WD40 repeat-like protein [Gonapodya prolifera JEL478]
MKRTRSPSSPIRQPLVECSVNRNGIRVSPRLKAKARIITVAAPLQPDFSSCPTSRLRLSLAKQIRERELGYGPGWHRSARNGSRNTPSLRFHVENFVSSQKDVYHCQDGNGDMSPPFACSYANGARGGKLLAVVDEGGSVHLVDTSSADMSNQKPLRTWTAHQNAIFDVAWTSDDSKIVTASGDQRGRVWDVERALSVANFEGHSSSVKAVATCPTEPHIYATGSRDGKVVIWDTRCVGTMDEGGARTFKPANVIVNAHVSGRSTSRPPSKQRKTSSPVVSGSVTQVAFSSRTPHCIFSSGSGDGTIKLWDIRSYHTNKHSPVPVNTTNPRAEAKRARGFTSLCLSKSGTYLYACCTDSTIQQYSANSLGDSIATYSDARYNSFGTGFFVRISVSPDDAFIVSGSTSGSVFIWDVAEPERSAWRLGVHNAECSPVAWCNADWNQIAACGDDGVVRLWNASKEDREQIQSDVVKRGMFLVSEKPDSAVRTKRGQRDTNLRPPLAPIPQLSNIQGNLERSENVSVERHAGLQLLNKPRREAPRNILVQWLSRASGKENAI